MTPPQDKEGMEERFYKLFPFAIEVAINVGGDAEMFDIRDRALDFALSESALAVKEALERQKKDMLIKMANWHGTGKAMIEDYFASLSNQ